MFITSDVLWLLKLFIYYLQLRVERESAMKGSRKLLIILVIGLCVAASIGVFTRTNSWASNASVNWVQAGFNRERTGYNPFETAISSSNVSQLKVAWSGYASGSPIENNGLLYFSDSYSSTLYAVSASTGADVWTSIGRGGVYGTAPAIAANGVLYSGTPGGTLYAIRASTGALVWASTTGTGFDASPLWANGIVYIGSQNGRFYAFNATSGKVLWSFLTSGAVDTGAATDNGIVYVDSGGTLYALNGKTGKLLWRYAAQGPPVVANGLVYIGTNEVIALNETSGKLVWTYFAEYGARVSSVAAANGDVFFSDGNGTLHAVNALTGSQTWSFDDTSGQNTVYSTPVVANGVVYAGGYLSNEHALEMAFSEGTGVLLWSDFDENSYDQGVSPIVINGMLFYDNGDNDTMWAYRL
jgi:outer membrane protein assembly factor BamB